MSRLSHLIDRMRATSPGEPDRAEPAIPPEVLDEIGSVRALAEDGLARADYALAVARDMSLPTRILAFMSWLELNPPAAGPLVSVVLATRDRPELLKQAIASVIDQRHGRWELVVVDDGTTRDAKAVTDAVNDERLIVVEGPRSGLSAARNAGLEAAGGDVVCYLDDDNVMHPVWLQAVAHVFSSRGEVDGAYGVTIAEHRIPDNLTEEGWWPSFWQLPWSRETLLEENVADAGALAHRRQLEEARFDESLSTGEDWDLLIRLTANRAALAVPALSHAYSMGGADRMSRDSGHKPGLKEIRRRHAEG